MDALRRGTFAAALAVGLAVATSGHGQTEKNFPSKPLSLPNPFGKRLEVEFSNIRFVFTAPAFKKITLAKYSVVCFDFASMTRTPVATPCASSNIIE